MTMLFDLFRRRDSAVDPAEEAQSLRDYAHVTAADAVRALHEANEHLDRLKVRIESTIEAAHDIISRKTHEHAHASATAAENAELADKIGAHLILADN